MNAIEKLVWLHNRVPSLTSQRIAEILREVLADIA